MAAIAEAFPLYTFRVYYTPSCSFIFQLQFSPLTVLCISTGCYYLSICKSSGSAITIIVVLYISNGCSHHSFSYSYWQHSPQFFVFSVAAITTVQLGLLLSRSSWFLLHNLLLGSASYYFSLALTEKHVPKLRRSTSKSELSTKCE